MRAVTATALLVLAFGLPRVLVLCTEHDGSASLAFAHAPGSCCHDATAFVVAAGEPGIGMPCAGAHEACEHSELAVELAPAPRPHAHGAETPPPAGSAPPALPEAPARHAAPTRPPATGPPRPDARTALRATTLLLV
ncbi:MAG: DUF169 domain-containing protein [Planctomycetes bacterium]|nr:DUF169 domain-containing protein [Planctomycetota bacterium]